MFHTPEEEQSYKDDLEQLEKYIMGFGTAMFFGSIITIVIVAVGVFVVLQSSTREIADAAGWGFGILSIAMLSVFVWMIIERKLLVAERYELIEDYMRVESHLD